VTPRCVRDKESGAKANVQDEEPFAEATTKYAQPQHDHDYDKENRMTASQQEEQILLAALDIAEKSHQHRCSGAIQPSNSSCNQSHSSSAQLSSVLAPQQLQRPTLTASTPLNPCNRACNTQVQHMTLTTPETSAPQLNSTRNLSPAVFQPRLPQLQQTQPNSRLLHPHVRT
jgi:hypothetical protein